MPFVCFHFQVHQPARLRAYSFFDIGHSHVYEDGEGNSATLRQLADRCYLPMNALLTDLIARHGKAFRVSLSLSGAFLEQMAAFAPRLLTSFQELVDTGCVEILASTYAHEPAFPLSPKEWEEQVVLHDRLVRDYFQVRPVALLATGAAPQDLAGLAGDLGYRVLLAEACESNGSLDPNRAYRAATSRRLKVLFRNRALSDDIAFRFADREWPDYPLTAEKYASWLHRLDGSADVINLAMDYETFGGHVGAETGILDFFSALPEHVLANPAFSFATPSEAALRCETREDVDLQTGIAAPLPDCNELQTSALEAAARLEEPVRQTGDGELLAAWRRLAGSDHFRFMAKAFIAGPGHRLSPYETSYDAYIFYMNALTDLEGVVRERLEARKPARRPRKAAGAGSARKEPAAAGKPDAREGQGLDG